MNTTLFGIVFCDTEWQATLNFNKTDFDIYIPCKFDHHEDKQMILYSLLYNYTLSPWLVSTDEGHSAAAKYDSLFKLKMSVDNAILYTLGKERGFKEIPTL